MAQVCDSSLFKLDLNIIFKDISIQGSSFIMSCMYFFTTSEVLLRPLHNVYSHNHLTFKMFS